MDLAIRTLEDKRNEIKNNLLKKKQIISDIEQQLGDDKKVVDSLRKEFEDLDKVIEDLRRGVAVAARTGGQTTIQD